MQTSKILAWIASGVLAFIGGWAILGNYSVAILWYVRRKRGSLAPLFGGVLFGLAMLLCPLAYVRLWAWIPLIVDLGCAPLFGSWLFHYLFTKRDDK